MLSASASSSLALRTLAWSLLSELGDKARLRCCPSAGGGARVELLRDMGGGVKTDGMGVAGLGVP